MKTTALLLALVSATVLQAETAAAREPVHPCSEDAKEVAMKVLQLHTEGDDRAALADDTVNRAPVKIPVGRGRLDVVEVTGYVYKAEYRIRVLYAQIPATCARMGFEIVEMSNPY